MKLLRIVLIISEALLLLLLVNPPLIGSHSFASAITAYHRDPTLQNESDLERQREIVSKKRIQQSTFLAALLALNSVGLIYVGRRL